MPILHAYYFRIAEWTCYQFYDIQKGLYFVTLRGRKIFYPGGNCSRATWDCSDRWRRKYVWNVASVGKQYGSINL